MLVRNGIHKINYFWLVRHWFFLFRAWHSLQKQTMARWGHTVDEIAVKFHDHR
jgi:hypothetical protein